MNDDAPVVVTFALLDESRDFVAALPARPITVFHTGVGDDPARRQRLRETLARERPRMVISAGYAGGLQMALRVGDLILGVNFSAPTLLTIARAALADESPHVGTLLTRTTVAETAAEKSALGLATGALAVDMETAWIAEACAEAAIPLLSLRVISDAVTQSFPVPGHILFDAARQRPRYVALPLWLLAHPARIVPFAAFVRGLGPARARLAHALCRLLSTSDSAKDSLPPP